MANASVDGLVSGLDTSSIISQLMQLERLPVARLEQKKSTAAAIASAYQAINTKFLTLQSAADKLTKADTWNIRTATSSSTNVAVTAATGALAGSFTFDVEQVAAAQSYVSDLTYSSTAAPVTLSSTIAITKGSGAAVVVDVGNGSLAAVVAGINANKDAGVRAAATQVSPGVYRLQLASTTTGLASDFTITDGVDPMNTSPLGTLDELVAGTDARIAVGDLASPGRYTVTSASNTLAEVMPGVTLTVKGEETGVTVDVVPDADAVAADVEAMVNAANGVLAEMKKLTAFDPTTKKGATLTGDSTVRGLQQEVLRLAAAAVGSGTASAAEAGVELNKDGTLKFTKATFLDAFNADPDATAALFRPGGTTGQGASVDAGLHSLISLSAPDDRTVPGTYVVKVTAAARQAKVVVTGAPADGDELTLTVPGKDPVIVTAGVGDDLAALAVKINTASAESGLGLVAGVEAGELVVRTVTYGSAPTFSLTSSGATMLAGAFQAGADVAGSINGVAATGMGQLLNAPPSDTTLWGLSLRIDATDADVAAAGPTNVFGTFTYAPGMAQRLDSLAGNVVRSGTGVLTTAIAGRNTLVESLEDQIAAWEPRLELKENALRRQYAALESSLGQLRSQSTWLAGQISGLMANSG